MRSSRVSQAVTCGLVVLLVAGCTGDPETPEPPTEEEPAALPTAFEGEPPPGVEGKTLRHLHGEDAGVHEIFDDPMGVRISPVGGAFLISSGGEDRHLLHDAASGDLLWEGEARFRGFDVDIEGEPVLALTDADDSPFVLDARGRTLWEPEAADDLYLDGLAVRHPGEWSVEEPHGDYTVLNADGAELWTYVFEPAEEDETDEDADSDKNGRVDEEPADPLGVPVTAWGETVLLDDGESALHAYSVDSHDAGEPLWSVTVDDEDLGMPVTAPVRVPRVLGVYPTPGAEAEATDSEDTAEDSEQETTRDVLLVRWAQPEAPSVLSAHDTTDGEVLWTLEEPGTNPVPDPFEEANASGTLYDEETGTLLLPQASGGATVIAVELAAGEVRWGLEEESGAFSPAFAHAGFVYGDARSNADGDRQVVLDVESKDVVADELDAYVEAVTGTGHAILVQDRQRFVYGPGHENPEEEEEGGEEDGDASPEDDAS